MSNGINALPNELLVCILSFLSLKEAAATSILCHRWRYLWTFTDKLDFDGTYFFRRVWLMVKHYQNRNIIGFLDNILSSSGDLEESWNYIAWVDNILGFHNGYRIQEFRVDFFLSEAHKQPIERWLRLASAKKVEILDLNLRWTMGGPPNIYYAWPSDLSIGFKHLRTMRMQYMSLKGEDVELLLVACPLLEELSVCFSKNLIAVKIMGPSLALKRLEISTCYVKSIEICDANNLVCFMYNGVMLEKFVLKNVPLLVEMHLGGGIFKCMKDFILMFSSYLPLLKKLTIDAFYTEIILEKEAKMFYNKVKMSNLEQLVFKFDGRSRCKLMPMTYFIRASPLLQSFVLEAYAGDSKGQERFFLPEKESWYEYPHLKRVEIIGYRGSASEEELVLHLLQNGNALEEFIVDLRKRNHAWMITNLLWPNTVSCELPIGYHSNFNGIPEVIDDFKTLVKNQLTKKLPSRLQHLHLNII